jgi:hypothetical protein
MPTAPVTVYGTTARKLSAGQPLSVGWRGLIINAGGRVLWASPKHEYAEKLLLRGYMGIYHS